MRLSRLTLAAIAAVAALTVAGTAAAISMLHRTHKTTSVSHIASVGALGVALQHRRQVVDGQSWSVTTYTKADGELCGGINVPGEGQQISCWSSATMFAKTPLIVQTGATQSPGNAGAFWDAAAVWGFASPAIAKIDLVSTDCTHQSVSVDSTGVFLYVAGATVMHSTSWPKRIAAFDSAGSLLSSLNAHLGPPDTSAAKASGAHSPPEPHCA